MAPGLPNLATLLWQASTRQMLTTRYDARALPVSAQLHTYTSEQRLALRFLNR